MNDKDKTEETDPLSQDMTENSPNGDAAADAYALELMLSLGIPREEALQLIVGS